MKTELAIAFGTSKNLKEDFLVDVRNPRKIRGPHAKRGKWDVCPIRKIWGPLGKTDPAIESGTSKNLGIHIWFAYIVLKINLILLY